MTCGNHELLFLLCSTPSAETADASAPLGWHLCICTPQSLSPLRPGNHSSPVVAHCQASGASSELQVCHWNLAVSQRLCALSHPDASSIQGRSAGFCTVQRIRAPARPPLPPSSVAALLCESAFWTCLGSQSQISLMHYGNLGST